MKQLILFHQRQRQYLTIGNLISDKLKILKDLRREKKEERMERQENDDSVDERPQPTRKLKRHSQNRRVNYVDDFQYDDSREEDFNADSILSD